MAENLPLSVERYMIKVFAACQFCQQGRRRVASCNGPDWKFGCSDFAGGIVLAFVSYRYTHPHIRRGKLKMFGLFCLFKDRPFVLVTFIALRIQLFIFTTKLFRKRLTDRGLFLIRTNCHLTSFAVCLYFLGCGFSCVFLFFGEFSFTKVNFKLSRVIRQATFLAHLAPKFPFKVFQLADEFLYLLVFLADDSSELAYLCIFNLKVCILGSDAGFVSFVRCVLVRQLSHPRLSFLDLLVKLVTVVQKLLYESYLRWLIF